MRYEKQCVKISKASCEKVSSGIKITLLHLRYCFLWRELLFLNNTWSSVMRIAPPILSSCFQHLVCVCVSSLSSVAKHAFILTILRHYPLHTSLHVQLNHWINSGKCHLRVRVLWRGTRCFFNFLRCRERNRDACREVALTRVAYGANLRASKLAFYLAWRTQELLAYMVDMCSTPHLLKGHRACWVVRLGSYLGFACHKCKFKAHFMISRSVCIRHSPRYPYKWLFSIFVYLPARANLKWYIFCPYAQKSAVVPQGISFPNNTCCMLNCIWLQRNITINALPSHTLVAFSRMAGSSCYITQNNKDRKILINFMDFIPNMDHNII